MILTEVLMAFAGCLDMLATEGYFTFMASRPQLACAAFVIAEPNEVISLELSDVNIDCSAGDFIKVVPLSNTRLPCAHTDPQTPRSGILFFSLYLFKIVPNGV